MIEALRIENIATIYILQELFFCFMDAGIKVFLPIALASNVELSLLFIYCYQIINLLIGRLNTLFSVH